MASNGLVTDLYQLTMTNALFKKGMHERKVVFDRFYRGDASRKDKKHFGLGLSIAKELTEMHGGTLAVHDNPGGGSRFVVTLTLQQA